MKKITKFTMILLFLISCLSAQTESKRIYAGARLGGSIGMVFPTGDDYRDYYEADSVKWRDGGSFDIAPFVSFQITDKFALQTEVMITKFGYFGIIREYDYADTLPKKELITRRALIVPILAKYTRRQNNFSFQGFIGPHFTFNVGDWDMRNTPDDIAEHIKYPLVGITIGANFGIITQRSGTVFIDVRFAEDLGMVKTGDDSGGTMVWTPILLRGKLSFSLGWEFGFINR